MRGNLSIGAGEVFQKLVKFRANLLTLFTKKQWFKGLLIMSTTASNPPVRIWADLGDSSGKFIVHPPNGDPQKIIMGSRVALLDDFQINQHQLGEIIKLNPLSDAWVKLGKQYAAVGNLAQKYAHDATRVAEQKEPKQNTALFKLLAIVGAVREIYNLPEKFDLDLVLLLPYPEYKFASSKQNNFQKQLKEALSRFYFRGTALFVKLANFSCKPEGAGLIMLRYQVESKPEDWLSNRKIAALMFGERNTSLLIFDGGASSGYTNNLGFYHLIESVLNLSLSQTAASLTKAIISAGNDLTASNPHIRALAHIKGDGEKNAELSSLVSAIDSGKRTLWKQISTWAKPMVGDADELIIGGGAALLYEKEIAETFSDKMLFELIAKPSFELQLPAEPVPPSGDLEELRKAWRDASFGEREAAKEAFYRHEKLLEEYRKKMSAYKEQVAEIKAAAASRERELLKLPQTHLRRKAEKMMGEMEQTFFNDGFPSESEYSSATRFVDIYGVWKGTRHG